MAWYWWVLLGLACWIVLPAIVLGPTLGRLLARRAEEQLTPLPRPQHVAPEDLGPALTQRLEEIITAHRAAANEPPR